MNLFDKTRIKLNSLREYYFFQKWGLPAIKSEKISKSFIKKFLPLNPVTIDCGAHDGADSVELSKVLGGPVHAFEALPHIYKRLLQRTKKDKLIFCYPLALSNTTGHQNFYVSEGNSDASSSLLQPKDHLLDHPDTYFNQTIEVQTITLDSWANQHKVDHVDLLWLDMQGYELHMLKASEKILPTVKAIHTEVSTKETYNDVPLYKEYKSYLENKGFKVVVEAIPTGWDMGNVLFVRDAI
jgi:FkbM family methyltransferase